MDWNSFYQLIREAERTHLWGEIAFSFRDGKLTFIRTTKTEEPQTITAPTKAVKCG